MDPVSLIVAALVAGAAAGLKDTATNAVKDGYNGLKALLRRHFPGATAVHADVETIDKDPAADTTALESTLREAGAGNNAELVQAAGELMKQVDPAGSMAGKYTVTISGGKGIVVGNEGSVTMNFNDRD